jgi:nicotinate-nucleotide adenylyltransferase
MNELTGLMRKIKRVFEGSFGTTPLRQRNEDIYKEALELSRFTSIANLKEEHGDLLCTLLMSFAENGWDPTECIEATLTKIKKRKLQYHAYGRKISTVILGGAFDPITPGHVAVAEFLLNFSTIFDSVWLMPCYKHMYDKQMEAPDHRLNMCRLATKHDRRIKVSDYEIVNKLGGETYTLIKSILDEDFAKHQYDFSLAIGMDNANTFDRWVNYHDLERMIRCIIVPRTGIKTGLKSNWYLKPPHMLVVPNKPLPKTCSTEVRETLRGYWDMQGAYAVKLEDPNFINPEVLEYIKKNSLYKGGPK